MAKMIYWGCDICGLEIKVDINNFDDIGKFMKIHADKHNEGNKK